MMSINLCKNCINRQLDLHQGIVCKLSKVLPAIGDECRYFEPDERVAVKKVQELRSNEQRGKTLLFLIRLVLFLELISLVSSGLQYNLLLTLSNGGAVSDAAATANDLREQAIGIIYLIAYIASGIAFISWFRRAYFNLHQRVDGLSYSDGWAAGSWFVPFINLYRPYQIFRELYEETKRYLSNREGHVSIHLNSKFLGVWWTMWLINGVLGQFIFRLSRMNETLPDFITYTLLQIISGILGILLAIITLKVVKDYIKAEEILNTGVAQRD